MMEEGKHLNKVVDRPAVCRQGGGRKTRPHRKPAERSSMGQGQVGARSGGALTRRQAAGWDKALVG